MKNKNIIITIITILIILALFLIMNNLVTPKSAVYPPLVYGSLMFFLPKSCVYCGRATKDTYCKKCKRRKKYGGHDSTIPRTERLWENS